MSPPAFRATFPGVAYQLGNVRDVIFLFYFFFENHKQMVSSAASQIEASAWTFFSLN
jgi:hypothetical protein